MRSIWPGIMPEGRLAKAHGASPSAFSAKLALSEHDKFVAVPPQSEYEFSTISA